MKVQGTVFEIDDLNGFVVKLLDFLTKFAPLPVANKRSLAGGLAGTAVGTVDETVDTLGGLLPDAVADLIGPLTSSGVVRPLAGARVRLGLLPPPSLSPGQHVGGFLPAVRVEANTNAAGAYTLTVSDERPPQLAAPRGFILVHKPSTQAIPVGQFQIFSLLYRSASFELGQGDRVALPIFVRRVAGRTEQGVTQTEINRKVEAIRRQRKFDKMDARIGNDEIAVRVEDRGAKATFDIALRGSQSPNLDELLDLRVRNFAIDLPGPDFVTTLCVDEAQVERDARSDVSSLERSTNKEIRTQVVNEVSQATGLPPATVEDFFKDFATVSIAAVNVRRQTVKKGSNVGLVPTIVLDVGLGFPRRLFG